VILKHIRYLVTQNSDREILENVDVRVEGDKITEIGESLSGGEEVDCSGKVVMPGMINCHTHVSMTMFRGISDNKVLEDWLHEDIFPAEEEMTDEEVYEGAKLGIREMLATGTTTFNDMYMPERKVAEAVDELGIRAVLTNGFVDIDGEGERKLEMSRDFIEEYLDHPRITPAVGPHAVYTCSPEILEKAREIAEEYDTKIHIHVSETETENRNCIEERGKTPVQHLDELGLIGERTIAAHGVHLNDEDIELLSEKDAAVSHNPCANLKLGSGVADVPKLRKNGVTTGLGTDGPASNNNLNMFDEMKFASLIQKNRDPTQMTEQEVLDMATIDGAEVVGLGDEIGSVEEGKKADLVLVDLDRPDMRPVENTRNLVSNLVFSFNGEVDATMVDGDFVQTNGF
jgi:5-methylthioadenosine/S-adenosylhomocysteine deaminase